MTDLRRGQVCFVALTDRNGMSAFDGDYAGQCGLNVLALSLSAHDDATMPNAGRRWTPPPT
jgi:hypothetical protein